MLYSKPELVVLDNSIELIQSGVCKSSTHNDNVISGHQDATATAYEADE